MRLKEEPSKTRKNIKIEGSKGPKKSTRASSKKRPLTREEALAKVFSVVDIEELASDDTYQFTKIDTMDKLFAAYEQFLLDDPATVAVDTETQGLRWDHRIIGVSFSWSESQNYYIPMRHLGDSNQLFVEDCWRKSPRHDAYALCFRRERSSRIKALGYKVCGPEGGSLREGHCRYQT